MFTHCHYTDWIILICKSSVLSHFFLCSGMAYLPLPLWNPTYQDSFTMPWKVHKKIVPQVGWLPCLSKNSTLSSIKVLFDSLALNMDGNPFKHPPTVYSVAALRGAAEADSWASVEAPSRPFFGSEWMTKLALPPRLKNWDTYFIQTVELLNHRYLASSPRKCALLNTVWIQNLHMRKHACPVSVRSDAFHVLFVCLFVCFYFSFYWSSEFFQAESHIRQIDHPITDHPI